MTFIVDVRFRPCQLGSRVRQFSIQRRTFFHGAMTAPATLLGRSGAVNVLTAAKGGACEGKPREKSLECLDTENHTEPHLCSSTPKPELEAPRCWIPCCQHGTVLMVVILSTYFSAANGIFRYRYTMVYRYGRRYTCQ